MLPKLSARTILRDGMSLPDSFAAEQKLDFA